MLIHPTEPSRYSEKLHGKTHRQMPASDSYMSARPRTTHGAFLHQGIRHLTHPPDSTTDWAPTSDWPAMPATCGRCAPHCRQSMRSFHHSPTSTPCGRQCHGVVRFGRIVTDPECGGAMSALSWHPAIQSTNHHIVCMQCKPVCALPCQQLAPVRGRGSLRATNDQWPKKSSTPNGI